MCKLVEDPGIAEPDFACTWSHGGGETAWVWPVGELDRETLPLLDEALTPAFSAARLIVLGGRRMPAGGVMTDLRQKGHHATQ